MAQIVDIERRGSSWTVRFDTAPQLRCSRAFGRRLRLAAGQEIDSALLERVRETAAADFADELVRRMLRRPRSRREIAGRLLHEGVPEAAVRSALEQLALHDEYDEDDDALELARRCVPQSGPDWNEVRRRCGQRLRRRGFSAATALRAVQIAWQEAQQEAQQTDQQTGQQSEHSPDEPHCAPDDVEVESVGSAKFRSRVP